VRELKILLAIDGGGLFGVGVADWVPKLGNDRRFDYYAGTSVGSILAACYAIGLEPLKVQKMFNSGLAKRIFTKPGPPECLNPMRPAIYSNNEAKKVLLEVFEDRQVKDVDYPLVIVAWNYGKRREKVFTSEKCNNTYLLREAVLASMSAPTFFPVLKLKDDKGENEWLGDGGVCGNDPSLAGISAMRDISVVRSTPIQTRHIKCLSIGTPGVPKEKKKFNVLSRLGWLPVIVDVITQGNVSYTSYGVSRLLGERYLRVSPTTLPEGSMDDFKLVPAIKEAWARWDHLEAVGFLSEMG
jgi:predicted acylesterase/phospholipase RssA